MAATCIKVGSDKDKGKLMKVIGTVLAIFVNGELTNADYAGGAIVEMSKTEMSILSRLEDAIEGNAWNYSRLDRDVGNIEMSDFFAAVRDFVIAKYAINELQEKINGLNDIVMGITRKDDA